MDLFIPSTFLQVTFNTFLKNKNIISKTNKQTFFDIHRSLISFQSLITGTLQDAIAVAELSETNPVSEDDTNSEEKSEEVTPSVSSAIRDTHAGIPLAFFDKKIFSSHSPVVFFLVKKN